MNDAFAYPPRGLSRDEAARYVGVSPSQFDRLVDGGTLPRPKRLGTGRILWDRIALDIAFGDLPDRDSTSFRDMLEKTRKTSTLQSKQI